MTPSKSTNLLLICRTNGTLRSRVLSRTQSILEAFFSQDRKSDSSASRKFNVFLCLLSTSPGCFPEYILNRSAYIHDQFPIHEELKVPSIGSADIITSLVFWSRLLSSSDTEILWIFGHGQDGLRPSIEHTLAFEFEFKHETSAELEIKLSLEEIERAMLAIENTQKKLEVLFLESCSVGQLEMAQAVSHGTRYLVSSSQWVDIDDHMHDLWLSQLPHIDSTDAVARLILGSQAACSVAEAASDMVDTRHRAHTGTVLDLIEIDAVLLQIKEVIRLYSEKPGHVKLQSGMIDTWGFLRLMIESLACETTRNSIRKLVYDARLRFQISTYAAHDAAVEAAQTLSLFATSDPRSKLGRFLQIDRILSQEGKA